MNDNEVWLPAPVRQQILKNQLQVEKYKALRAGQEIANQVQVSELKKVKGF